MTRYLWQVLVVTAVLAAGCNAGGDQSGQTSNPVSSDPGPNVADARYLLSEEPAGAKGVIELRKYARDGDEVVIVGRVGGRKKPLTSGQASFTIVDPSLEPCEDGGGWDYCCTPKDELLRATAFVKFVDEKGRTLAKDARHLLGIKELQTVVVRGPAKRDDAGNLVVLASGLYVRKK